MSLRTIEANEFHVDGVRLTSQADGINIAIDIIGKHMKLLPDDVYDKLFNKKMELREQATDLFNKGIDLMREEISNE